MRHLILVALSATSAPALAQQAAPQPITRAAFEAKMDADFATLDSDKNGTVSAAELQAARVRTATSMAERRTQAMFQELDSDKNGSLSQAEFTKLISVDTSKLPPAPLLKFDSNKDGSVSKTEFKAGANADFARTDANKDGTVTSAEIQAASAPPKKPSGR